MGGQDNLSPQQFFHGTTADLKPGDTLVPGAQLGANHHPQVQRWRNQHVWATPDERGAWWYAGMAENKSGNHRVYNHAVGDARRGRVYEVEPVGEAPRRRRLSSNEPVEHSMASAKVIRRIDIPPPDKEAPPHEGVQGRLPVDKSWDNWMGLIKYSGHETSWEDNEHWSRGRHPEAWETPEQRSVRENPPKPKDHPGQGRLF